jgi:putative hydrolase of HD superfamily
MIAWFLAKMEKADPYKAIMIASLHDVKEVRSGDHNYIHKKYIKIFEDEILKDQLSDLPFGDLFKFVEEFEERKSKEAIIAKDADLLDQMLLLKEYAHQGNKEAEIWLNGKGIGNNSNIQYQNLKTESAQKLGREILSGKVSEWWENIWTPKNR